ncbi:hypothetical protein ACHAXH_007349 [Discostella pseudostelligera]
MNNRLSARRNSWTRIGGIGAGASDAVAASDIPAAAASSPCKNSTTTTTTTPSAASENSTMNNTNNSNNMKAVDFIGSSTAVKHLFSLPYNNDRSMSMALHNLGNGTFLLDSGEEFGNVSAAGSDSNSGTAPFTASANNNNSAASSLIDGTFLRRGRRRQRPASWSTLSKPTIGEQDDDPDTLLSAADADTTDTTCEMNPMHIAQLREKERSLLTSLVSLLENDEDEDEVTKTHFLLDNDHEAVVVAGGSSTPTNSPGAELKSLNERDKKYSVVTPTPSNAIIVSCSSNNNITSMGASMSESVEPIVGSVMESNFLPNQKINYSEPNDPLGNVLPPPQHYLSQYAGVSPPAEPRQYVNWNFHDMKLLVASDAIIYNQGGGGDVGEQRPDDEFTEPSSSMISIRIEDASQLKSQMIDMIQRKEERRVFVNDNEGGTDRLSYAEALLMPSSINEEHEGGHRGQFPAKEEVVGAEVAAENVEMLTSIIPSLEVELQSNEWAARLGFTHSPFCPHSNTSNDDSSGGASIEPNCASSASETGGKLATASSSSTSSSSLPLVSCTPICTVIDAYLDNIMANVPQLALILREHGFVQNIKLLRTEDIPSLMMHPSTLGGESATHPNDPPPPIFSPDIVEMNAAMLLRFLKTNCTRENSTYLLHRAAGEANIQLFDISSISKMRQRKWVWWLALCSYRFACRLDQLRTNALSPHDDVLRRDYRRRQRNLLQNTLDLLEELADMDGGRRHDTIGAAVCEHLADTYLWNNDETGLGNAESRQRTDTGSVKSPSPCAASYQPYRKVTVDCLNKAHDHLMNGIKKLTPLLVKAREGKSAIEIEALSTQLYGIYHKVVNVNLRLADRHLKNYFSSNLIQSLRYAARMLSEATSLIDEFIHPQQKQKDQIVYIRSILLQYSWLWEYCGHFARSFAADGLWRDRGHTCGADLIGLLREVNMSCDSIRKQCFGAAGWKPKISVEASSHGQVSLNSLSGIVILPKDFEQIEASVLQKEGCHEAIGAAKAILDQKTQIKRDALLVLVAASICFGHSIDSYVFLASFGRNEALDCDEVKNCSTIKSPTDATLEGVNLISSIPDGAITIAPLLRRLGDSCNEIGKILLNESREVLLPQFVPPDNISGMVNTSFGLSHVSAIMLASAKFWFVEGLEQFTHGNDLRNIALLRCNLCQCCKIRANANVILPGSSGGDSKKSFLQEAVDNLVLAHEALGQRDTDPVTWDMVSEELAATLLVLGVRRRQSMLPSSSEPLQTQASRLSPGAEKAIVEPMERSCKIYESLGTARASHQAAAAHYQLALYFSKVWTCQRDETKTREKLSAAFMHYGLAHQYFFKHIRGNETTFVMLSLDFSNLYSSVSGEECLSRALMCCLDTRAAFSLPLAPELVEQMIVLADNVEARLSKLLLSLVKIAKENNTGQSQRAGRYKDMYREALRRKVVTAGNITQNSKEVSSEKSQHILLVSELLQTMNDLYKA